MPGRIPCLIALACVALVPHPADAARPEAIHREALPEGPVVIFHEGPAGSTFALRVLARGGQAEDPVDRDGLTTLLSRMLLRGAGGRDAGQQARAVESTGSTIEPVSGLLGFGVAAQGPAEGALPVLEVALEALLHPAIEETAFDSEKALLTQSLRISLDNPSTHLDRAAWPILMPGHPLGRTADPDVWLASIEAIDLRRALAARVTADRLVIVLAGPVDRSRALEAIRVALRGTAQRGASPARLPAALSLPAPVVHRVKARTPQPEILLAFPTRGCPPSDEAAMDLLMHLLTGYQERIAGRLRDREGWAYWIEGLDVRYPEAGVFGVRTAVPGRRLERAAAIIEEEIRRIATEAPSEAEVERARRYLATQRARAWQRASFRAAADAAAELRGAPLSGIMDQEARMASVSPETIRALAGRITSWSESAVITLR